MKPKKQKFEQPFKGITSKYDVQGLLFTDKPLSTGMISSLTNINVRMGSVYDHTEHEEPQEESALGYYLGLLFASLVIALMIGFGFSFAHNIGPFADDFEVTLN